MAGTKNVTVNVSVNWEPVNPSALALVVAQMSAAREEYDESHDDHHGYGHLVNEAARHLARLKLFLGEESSQREIAIAIGLLFHAYDAIDRSVKASGEELPEADSGQLF
jgi:hypothetical protein